MAAREPNPRPETRKQTAHVVLCCVPLIVACQSYAPRPLDPAAHLAAWTARTPASVSEFLRELRETEGVPALQFDATDGLTLAEARLVALAFQPRLRVARLELERAHASAEQAGYAPDPQLSLGWMRIQDDVPDRWFLNPVLSFTIPLSARLDAEVALADAEAAAARARVRDEEWQALLDLENTWLEWSATDLTRRETERYLDTLRELTDQAAELVELGELPSAQAALFELERMGRSNQLLGLRGELGALEARLKLLLGLTPEAPVELIPDLAPRGEAAPLVARASLHEANPRLAELARRYRASEEALRLELERQLPDLSIGPQLEEDAGQTRLGLQLGIRLPLWNRNRRAIAEARLDRELARARFETELETLVSRIAGAEARSGAESARRRDLEQTVVPRVDRQLEQARDLLALGEGSTLVLLESVGRAFQTKLDLIATRRAESRARAELAFLQGEPLPLLPVATEPER